MSTADNAASSSAPSTSTSSRLHLTHSVGSMCHHCQCHNHASPSPYSSPHSASLPSPPDSPPLDPYADIDLDSISSFPSVSSSVFFSSSAGSPGSQPRYSDHEHDGLIIPSLTLPSRLQQPTAYGQAIGDVSLLLVGPSGGGKTALAEFLADGDDIVDAADWEDLDGGRVLRASTYWIEEHDPHGLERYDGAENISLTELDGFDSSDNPERVADCILKNIRNIFTDVRNQVDSAPSSTLLYSLLASSHSPLYTALIYVIATPLTAQDREIISTLSSAIPVIIFCTTTLSSGLTSFSHGAGPLPKLATFQPHSQLSLRTGLFRTPQTISVLRADAADRFMRWREAERVIDGIAQPCRTSDGFKSHTFAAHRRSTVTQCTGIGEEFERWSKATWEAMLSEDVARRLRHVNASDKKRSDNSVVDSALFSTTPCFTPALDPLHFRSLMVLSLSLLVPCHASVRRSSRSRSRGTTIEGTHSTVWPWPSWSPSGKGKTDTGKDRWRSWHWGFALFCAGVGIGCMLSTIA